MTASLLRKLKIMLSVLAVIALLIGFSALRDRLKDRRGSTTADITTEKYRARFPIGTTMSEVKAELEASRVPTLLRGDGFVLAIVQDGAAPLYCSHKYWWTSFAFRDGKLVKLTIGEVLDECL